MKTETCFYDDCSIKNCRAGQEDDLPPPPPTILIHLTLPIQ